MNNRYVALDVLRGLTISLMIIVNNPGSWDAVFSPLRHARWDGCTPTDLVFPFFLFIVGTAMAFSFAKLKDGLCVSTSGKILRRGAMIFLVGLLLNAFPFYPTSPDPSIGFWDNFSHYWAHVRVLGVLQRIALCYIVGAFLILFLRRKSRIIYAMIALGGLYTLLLVVLGDSTLGVFTLQGQGVSTVDIAVLGESHTYGGYGVVFDPEGLLSTLSAVCTLLFGYLIGTVVRQGADKIAVCSRLYTLGLFALGAAMVLNVWIPINKALWSVSYVMYAGGWSTVLLALFIYMIDVRGRQSLFVPLRAIGLNPLFAYLTAELMAKTIGGLLRVGDLSVANWYYQRVCVGIVGESNELSSLLYSLSIAGVIFALSMVLYRKRIIIKL